MADNASVVESPEPAPAPKRWDRQLILAMLLGAAIVLPRSWDMAHKLSQYKDDELHLVRGLRFVEHRLGDTVMNDPPLGEVIGALPLLIEGAREKAHTEAPLFGHPPEHAMRRLVIIRMWKSLLFIPLLGVIFAWMRDLYGRPSVWLAMGIFCLEPNIAAHIPTPAIDLMGAGGILISVYTLWRFFQRPTIKRLLLASILMAVAMLLASSAILLPGIAILFAALWWIVRPIWLRIGNSQTARTQNRDAPSRLVSPIASICIGAGALFMGLWVLCLFDLSRPTLPVRWQSERPALVKKLSWPMPMGAYVSSICQWLDPGQHEQSVYLFGQSAHGRWWYYFPVVCFYKVPIGIGVLVLLALISIGRQPPRWDEWALFLPAVVWCAYLMVRGADMGIRQFLPAYVFILLLSCRSLRGAGPIWSATAWLCVLWAGISGLAYHPDYIAYFNWPRAKPYLAISDSNVDWGQSLIEVREWLRANPPGDRPVSIVSFAGITGQRRQLYLPEFVQVVSSLDVPPRRGLLIISPVREVGIDDQADRYAPLRPPTPVAIIGHNFLVYDLDQVEGWSSYIDRKSVELSTAAPATQASTVPATSASATRTHEHGIKAHARKQRKAP